MRRGDDVSARSSRKAVRKVLRFVGREIGKACQELVARDMPGDELLHDARKRLKRARAGLRLTRTALGAGAYRRENLALRDAARRISDVRDAKVLVDTVEALASRAARREVPALRLVRARLLDERRAARETLTRNAVAGARRSLAASASRIERSKLRVKNRAALPEGLRRVYRAGRRSWQAALETTSTDRLHELRKQAKYLWHALEILEPETRVGQRACGRAHRLSRDLGADHDLALLVDWLNGPRGSSERSTRPLVRLATRRRTTLQNSALARAKRLYADKPRKFISRLGDSLR
jgi:CHAD domain-containing protein